MLYIIDQESHNEKKSKKSEDKGKITENKLLTEEQAITRVNLPKEPKKRNREFLHLHLALKKIRKTALQC